jgi:transcriptional regulator with XRE-family HTH domain
VHEATAVEGDDRTDESASAADRQRELGTRLRRLRTQQGLSLAQVEARSDGRWKAVVVGAYERGDRAVTIERLAVLADFYGVPLAHLLPGPTVAAPRADATEIALDLPRLHDRGRTDDPVGAVARFADRIRSLRGDHGGRVLTLRAADLRTLALASGVDVDDLRDQLTRRGVLAS